MSIGISKSEVFDSCPVDLEPYEEAHLLRLEREDTENYRQGLYMMRAIQAALSPKKVKYFEEPILKQAIEDSRLTEEQKIERELRQMIANEEAWLRNDKLRFGE